MKNPLIYCFKCTSHLSFVGVNTGKWNLGSPMPAADSYL